MDAATRAGLAPDVDISLVELYTDGATLDDVLVQGLRFEIVKGKPSFRSGARRDERADVTDPVPCRSAVASGAQRAAIKW